MSFVRKWVQQEMLSLSKSSEPQKDKYCMFFFVVVVVDPRFYRSELKVKLKPGGAKESRGRCRRRGEVAGMIVWSKYNIYLYDNVLIQPSTVCNEYRKKGRKGEERLILIREEFFIPSKREGPDFRKRQRLVAMFCQWEEESRSSLCDGLELSP